MIPSKQGFAVTVDDALCDPNLLKPNQKGNAFGTITHKPHQTLTAPKDPGYVDHRKRETLKHDTWTKVHNDYSAKPLMKLYEDETFNTNIMAHTFYHRFSPNKRNQANAAYQKRFSPQNSAKTLA